MKCDDCKTDSRRIMRALQIVVIYVVVSTSTHIMLGMGFFFFEDLILVSYRLERLIVNPSLEVGYFIIERWKMQDLKESC